MKEILYIYVIQKSSYIDAYSGYYTMITNTIYTIYFPAILS